MFLPYTYLVPEDTLFARIAVEEGFLSTEQVEQVRGETTPDALPDILLRRGWLTAPQVQTIKDIERIHLAEVLPPSESGGVVRHDRLVLSCPDCATSYLIQGQPPGTRFVCRRCSRVLTIRGGTPEAASVAPLTTARSMGPWELQEEIGRGAASVVYRARHRETGGLAAVKVLRDSEIPSPALLKRFQEEIRAVRRLSHPNIVPLHDAGEDSGYHYLAMDLIEGRTLAQALADRSLRLVEFTAVLEIVARAVHYAHGLGIIHRDLKPANIILDREGRPHITDFGLAKIDQPEKGASQAGGMMGTPFYMSPEQVSGDLRATDPRSDIYALGVMLYEALTGRLPYPGPSVLDVYRGIMSGSAPRPRSINASAAPDLETLCMRSLEREKARRPATAEEFADALRRWREGPRT